MSSRQVISQWPAVAGQPPSNPLTVSTTDPYRAVRPQETISFVRISSIVTIRGKCPPPFCNLKRKSLVATQMLT